MFAVISHRNIFLSIAGLLVLVAVAAGLVWQLHLGIDFRGGTMWQLKINQGATSQEELRAFLSDELNVKGVAVYADTSTNTLIARMEAVSETDHQRFLTLLKQKFGAVEEQRFDTIGPAVGKSVEQKAVWAILLVLIGISLYVTLAFRKVSYPIKSWKYGAITLVTLFHDVLITLGFYVFLGHFFGVEADINFVVAILVVMGFSVHDTIVVFDRIRENLLHHRQNMDAAGLEAVINKSVNETMVRSINTSVTLMLVLLALVFLGPISLRYFVITILVGVTVGTYSSIFVASPGLFLMSGIKRQ